VKSLIPIYQNSKNTQYISIIDSTTSPKSRILSRNGQ